MMLRALLLFLACAAAVAQAAEFRSVGAAAALMHAEPNAQSTKLAILTRDYPVEVLSQMGDWSRVRDATGQTAWMENKALSNRRTVLVSVQLAELRRAADARSPVLMWAEQQVVLELLDGAPAIWIKVKHRDGAVGFIRADQLWGL